MAATHPDAHGRPCKVRGSALSEGLATGRALPPLAPVCRQVLFCPLPLTLSAGGAVRPDLLVPPRGAAGRGRPAVLPVAGPHQGLALPAAVVQLQDIVRGTGAYGSATALQPSCRHQPCNTLWCPRCRTISMWPGDICHCSRLPSHHNCCRASPFLVLMWPVPFLHAVAPLRHRRRSCERSCPSSSRRSSRTTYPNTTSPPHRHPPPGAPAGRAVPRLLPAAAGAAPPPRPGVLCGALGAARRWWCGRWRPCPWRGASCQRQGRH